MTFIRAHQLRILLAGLAVVVAPTGASTLWAQGADPFRPYNRQYDPYTAPMAPAGAEAGQFVGGMPRAGNRGANQYQSYLDEVQGASREGTERYGIGLPYYRSSVDSTFDPKGTREYRPNFKADRSFEESQGLVTRKYLAYFSEKDPKKRAQLLREYNLTRTKVSRALSTRRENQARVLDQATDAAAAGETRRAPAAADVPPRSAVTDRTRAPNPAEPTRRGDARSIPPPPPLFGGGALRGGRSTRSPEDVLNRSRRLNSRTDGTPGAGDAPGLRSPLGGRPASDVPPPELPLPR